MKRFSYLKRQRSRGGVIGHVSSGLAPWQVAQRYGFVQQAPPRVVTIGIVTLGGQTLSSDTATAFKTFGHPAPKWFPLSVRGAVPTPDPGGADVENAADVQVAGDVFAYCAGVAAVITEAFAPNDDNGIGDAIRALVGAGCEVISISWGASESQWTAAARAYTETALAYAASQNVLVFCASGDNSADDGTNMLAVDYPCGSASPAMIAVGGTTLTAGGESAWGDGKATDEGGGGGYDHNSPRPPWQAGFVSGAFRGAPDVSANADPNTGYSIFADGQWQVVGGTSLSAPLWAAYVAFLRACLPLPPQWTAATLYANSGAMNDITTGSDGNPTAPGWDAATGLGSPNGPKLAAMLVTASLPVQPPTPTPTPTPVPVPVPPPPTPVPVAGPTLAATIATVQASTNAVFVRAERYRQVPLELVRKVVDADNAAALTQLFAGG